MSGQRGEAWSGEPCDRQARSAGRQAGRSSLYICVCLGCTSFPGINCLLMEWPPRPACKCALPTSPPTPMFPHLAPVLGAPLHLPPQGGQGHHSLLLGRSPLHKMAPSEMPPLPLPPPPQNFLALGFAAELSSVSVVPGCQRLYISALLMLILCNHFLLQNLLAAR